MPVEQTGNFCDKTVAAIQPKLSSIIDYNGRELKHMFKALILHIALGGIYFCMDFYKVVL